MCLEKIEIEGKKYKVKYTHDRCWYKPTTFEEWVSIEPYILPKGGVTIAFIGDEGTPYAVGTANCSTKDTYDKNLGRKIACGRLLKRLGLDTHMALRD